MSIRLRLTLWYSGLLAGTLIGVGLVVYLFVNWNTYAEIKAQLKEQNEKIDIQPTVNFINGLGFEVGVDRTRLGEKKIYIQIVSYTDGLVWQEPQLRQLNTLLPYPEAAKHPKEGFRKVQVEIAGYKYDMLTYQRPIPLNDGTIVGLLQLSVESSNEEKFLTGLRTILVFSSIVVVFVAFTVGLFIARQTLRPIERVIQATEQIEKGSQLNVRIPAIGPNDEIGRLVNTLNGMLSRLETAYNELDDSYKAQRRFVSDASHELRTPLTTIRGNIDLLERMWTRIRNTNDKKDGSDILPIDLEYWDMSKEAMSDISAEAKRMSTLVNDLLALARADAGYVMEKETIELQPLTEEVARRAQLLPRTAEWHVGDLSALSGVYVRGNHDYLQQLLFIFIENAFKYTPKGYITLGAVSGQGQIGIIVEDTGIGMNPDEIPHIFDRFYRADESRGVTVGTGLGLSIAKWIIDEHQGSVEVTTLEGEGTKFTIWLPTAFPVAPPSTIIEGTDL